MRAFRCSVAAGLWKAFPQFRVGVLVVGGGVTWWVGSNIEQVPGSGRYRFNCVSEEYEAQLGRASHQQVMQEYRGDILSPRDPRHQLVGRVLARLVPNSGLEGDWEYHVIDDPDEVNAFVIPGRKVFVFSGLLPICKNDDGLAAVLGHEIAHNVAHHLQEKASLPYLMMLVVNLVTIFFDNSAQLTRFILNYGLALPNSRAQELTMEKDRNRVKQIQEWLPEAKQMLAESDCGAVTQFGKVSGPAAAEVSLKEKERTTMTSGKTQDGERLQASSIQRG
ncbi:MAG: hypothetical protein Q9196_002482 [Gyalolechia fulgens]